jgi:hypothetical protein
VEEGEEAERALVIGPVQARLIERASRSYLSLVIPIDRNERRSLLRLVRRGIMQRATGWPTCYELNMPECETMAGGKTG